MYRTAVHGLVYICFHTGTVPHIEGSTCYRDNVDDEWMIVSLLLSLTKEYPELVAR